MGVSRATGPFLGSLGRAYRGPVLKSACKKEEGRREQGFTVPGLLLLGGLGVEGWEAWEVWIYSVGLRI